MCSAPTNLTGREASAHVVAQRNATMTELAAECSAALPWCEVAAGVSGRWLERSDALAFRQTVVLRLDAGAELNRDVPPLRTHAGGEDFFVLTGELELDGIVCAERQFLGLPAGDEGVPRALTPSLVWWKSRPTMRARRVHVDTTTMSWERSHTLGFWSKAIDEVDDGRVVLLRFDGGVSLGPHLHRAGEEFFVLEGALQDEHGTYTEGCWVRQPPGSTHSVAAPHGCVMLTTAGHLLP